METLEVEVDEEVILPCYRHLHNGEFYDIDLLWGGRDSGKSREAAQGFVIECLESDYFRCILSKKTFESIKDAQWQTIKDVCEDWGLSHLFKFSVSPLSITCINGNKFIARGFDKAEKVKSISNPSHVWVEEADQLSHDDYITLATTLRRNDGKRVKQVLSFNPETKGEREQFWIYKTFFGDPDKRNFTGEYTIKDPKGIEHVYRYRSTHTTYRDNPFCTPDRQSVLESLKVTNPYYYMVYTLGEWGQRQVQRPFITAMRPEHITRNPVFDPIKPIYVSMDFNIDPFAFIFAHHWQDKDGEHLHIFDEATITNGSIHAAVEYLNTHYRNVIHKMTFTGDPGGNRREFSQRDNASLYTTLQRGLKLRPNQLIVPSAPTHKNSREEVNYFLHHFPDFQVHEERCKNLVFDMRFVEVDEHSSIKKSNRSKDEQRADHFDCFVGDTMITTKQGQKRIDSVVIGEMALTSKGYRRVLDSWSSYAEVYEFTFSNGSKVTCTKDHQFYNDIHGFLPIYVIFEKGLTVCALTSSITEESTLSTPSRNIIMSAGWGQTIPDHFTDKYGSTTLEKSNRNTTFTISTETRLTTIFQTWKKFMRRFIKKGTSQNGERIQHTKNVCAIWRKLDGQKQKLGTLHRKERSGTGNTHITANSDTKNTVRASVMCAERFTPKRTHGFDSVPTTANLHGEENRGLILNSESAIAEKSTRPTNTVPQKPVPDPAVTNLEPLCMKYVGVRKVYDITVEDAHEFYANGILVHNCMRYTVNTFFKKWIYLHQKRR